MASYSRKTVEDPPIRSWMLTFTDLLTLLLGFFVLRLSMSSLGGQGARESFDAVRAATDFGLVAPIVEPEKARGEEKQPETKIPAGSGTGPTDLSQRLSSALKGLSSKANDKLGPLPLTTDIELQDQPAGTLISLGSSIFQLGSDELSFAAKVQVKAIGGVLKEQLQRGDRFELRVEGHTDNTPINTPRFPSNWELSSARATRVAEQLLEGGVDPGLVSAVGYASTRPLRNVQVAEGRLRGGEKNRRVEILVVPQNQR